MNAMNGATGFHTMRINGHLGKKILHIFIDSGNTHNFLDVNLAKRLGCKMNPIAMQAVTIVDGNQLKWKYICKQFTWQMHGAQFVSDVLLILLGGVIWYWVYSGWQLWEPLSKTSRN